MKVMLIGSGGREHCIAWKVMQNPEVKELYCVPGNGGMSSLGICYTLNTLQDMVQFAKEKEISLTLIGPEAPLAKGVVDLFKTEGLAIVGPNQNAARLESSKVYAKEFMKKYKIPTAQFEVFNRFDSVISYLKSGLNFPLVIKADGLAAGKGVFIVEDEEEARDVVVDLMVGKIFGDAGNQIIIEECLEGEEATIMFLFDGKSYCVLPSSQDHKRIGDSDVGPNTGGMGAYSPANIVTPGLFKEIMDRIVNPTISALNKEGVKYCGVLYAGVMLTDSGPKALEFNARFGDPETQVILPRLKSDLVEIMLAASEGGLSRIKDLIWDNRYCVCVVLASKGYPGDYEKEKVIFGLDDVSKIKETIVFHSGTKVRKIYDPGQKQELEYLTSGGRVLGVCGLGSTIKDAISKAYQAVGGIGFQGAHYRKDIGFKALGL